MNEIKKRGPLIFAIVFVVVFCVMVFSGDKLEHIEDKNGSDNYNLQ